MERQKIIEQELRARESDIKKRNVDRFSAVYRTPGGQPISFHKAGVNTPPTPRFGGDQVRAAVDVEWAAYESVHKSHADYTLDGAPSGRGRGTTWPVVPAHAQMGRQEQDNDSVRDSRIGFIWDADWKVLPPRRPTATIQRSSLMAAPRDLKGERDQIMDQVDFLNENDVSLDEIKCFESEMKFGFGRDEDDDISEDDADEEDGDDDSNEFDIKFGFDD